MPVNKNMWTFSYILLCAGLANAVMMVMFIVEKQNIWLGWPFRYMGLNAILIYVGHEMLSGVCPFGWATSGRHFPAVFASL
jgi:heparan-alpha-glucosaminide N-acetyltransferase